VSLVLGQDGDGPQDDLLDGQSAWKSVLVRDRQLAAKCKSLGLDTNGERDGQETTKRRQAPVCGIEKDEEA
jgi:hypothetical protein